MEQRKINYGHIARIIFMGIKIAVVIYAIFDVSNLTILYQGF